MCTSRNIAAGVQGSRVPVSDLSLGICRIGTSKLGDLVNVREWVASHVSPERPVVFVLGAMAHGKVHAVSPSSIDLFPVCTRMNHVHTGMTH